MFRLKFEAGDQHLDGGIGASIDTLPSSSINLAEGRGEQKENGNNNGQRGSHRCSAEALYLKRPMEQFFRPGGLIEHDNGLLQLLGFCARDY